MYLLSTISTRRPSCDVQILKGFFINKGGQRWFASVGFGQAPAKIEDNHERSVDGTA